MEQEMRMIEQFHEKYGFKKCPIATIPKNHDTKINDGRLMGLGTLCLEMSKGVLEEAIDQQSKGDDRLYRGHLLLEELGEFFHGMAKRDAVLTADAITDLQYVLTGAAYTFEIPLSELFLEVHTSNMSKRRSVGNERMRDKGPDYFPPDIAGVLGIKKYTGQIPEFHGEDYSSSGSEQGCD